jgi:lipopolysaccharide export system protein LptA
VATAALVALALQGLAPSSVAAAPAEAANPPASTAAEPSKPESGGGDFLGDFSLGSSKEPINITANQLDFDYQQNRVTYKGEVRASQGDLVIDSDTLIVTFDRAEDQKQAQLREVIAQGNVIITQGTRKATGGTAVFSQTKRQILLMENPVLRDGPNEVTGDRIIVYLDEGRSVVESSQKKRVSAVLYPGSTEGGLGVAPAPGTVPAPGGGAASGSAAGSGATAAGERR